jgi:5-methyltetrahydropteroyltriglutamate--homocysteine methyltransferase
MANTFVYRIDHHGSLIRPAELLTARARHEAGELDAAALRSVEDEAIAEVVRLQRQLRYTVVTDGDFRREDVRGAILETVGGFQRTDRVDDRGYRKWVAAGELKADGPLVAEDIAAAASQTLIAGKASLPSPAYLAARCFDADAPGTPWKSAVELGEALARVIQAEIVRLISQGIELIQLNNPAYARSLYARGADTLSLEESIAIDGIAVDVGPKAESVKIGMNPTHRADSVNRAAAERLFSELLVDRWVLPYCTGAESEVDLLRAVPSDRQVCLGVVDPTVAELEDIDDILRRLDVAEKIRDMEGVAVSPSRGFSDIAGKASVGSDDQRRKLIHVETIARMVWGNEL